MKDDAILLMDQLTTDVNIELPVVDLESPLFSVPGGIGGPLYKEVVPLTNEMLTERVVDGQGTFDAIMSGVNAHLALQWDKGRITGDDYSKAYVALSEAAMGNAVEFLVQRDAAFWAAQTAQLQAITSQIQLEIEKTRLVALQAEALNAKANYALTKASLAKTATEHCILEYQLTSILPKESSVLEKQIAGLEHDNTAKLYNISKILPAQHAGLLEDNSIKSYNLTKLLPIDWDTKTYTLSTLLPTQNELLKEQIEVQLAQTSDSRKDGTAVVGTLGKQKDLYTQQIQSYKRSAEQQAAKLFTDAWTVMKTIDEGLTPPTNFANANIDTILASIKTANNL